MTDFRAFPKVNLHHHLEGAVRPQTFAELVQNLGIDVPALARQSAAEYLTVSGEEASLADFLDKIGRTFVITQHSGVLERIALEISESAAAESVRYLEVRFGPWLHVEQGRPLTEPIEEVLAGLAAGEHRWGVKGRLIISALRHHTFQQNRQLLDAAVAYRDRGVVALDLAGDEAAFPASEFRELFLLAAKAGLGVTIHAGEAGPAAGVWEAVSELGAQRVGHGIRLVHDPALLKAVRDAGTVLEVCPTSNVHTRAVESLSDHPVRELFDAGIRITIGDDDPTTSGITLSGEYQLLSEHFGFTEAELQTIVLTGAEAAFLPKDEKEELLASFRREFA